MNEVNARYREIHRDIERHFNVTLEQRPDLWNRTQTTDASGRYRRGRGAGKVTPNYAYMNGSGKKHRLAIHITQPKIVVVVGAPARQTAAQDAQRLNDMVYLLLTSKTEEEMNGMSNDDLREFFNSQGDAYYHIMVTDVTSNSAWSAERWRYENNVVVEATLEAEEIFQLRSTCSQDCPATAITNFISCPFGRLMSIGSSGSGDKIEETVDEMLLAMKRSGSKRNAKTDLKLDILFGSVAAGCNLAQEAPGLEEHFTEFDFENDIIVFNDGRKGERCNTHASKHKRVFAMWNKKSTAFHLMMRKISDGDTQWSPSVDLMIIRELLGDGTLHRIGYTQDRRRYRLVQSYSASEITLDHCKSKGVENFIYKYYYNEVQRVT